MSAHWERGWWRAGQQEMREERRMKMKEGKWDGKDGEGAQKYRGLWEKRDRQSRMVEKKQFGRRDGKSRWFMRYSYLVNGVFSQFYLTGNTLPGYYMHSDAMHLLLLIHDYQHTSGCIRIYTDLQSLQITFVLSNLLCHYSCQLKGIVHPKINI